MSTGLPRRASIFDFGANKKVLKEDSTIGVCPACGERHALARQAWYRSCRPQCRACGTYLEPSRNAQERFLLTTQPAPKAKRKCQMCGALLRSGNDGTLCAACQNKSGPSVVEAIDAVRRFLRPRSRTC